MMPLRFEYDIPARPIAEILKKQEEVFAEVRRGTRWNTVILAEHEPVYTYVPGKMSGERMFRAGNSDSLRAPLIPVHRAGSITFHGPGQLVSYFIFNLRKMGGGFSD